MEIVVFRDNTRGGGGGVDVKEKKNEEQQTSSPGHHLCDLITYEILTRVQLTSLVGQCQWVCKGWQKTMYETNFKLLHLQRTRAVSGYILQGYSKEDRKYVHEFVCPPSAPSRHISLEFLPKNNILIEASSPNGGLLLCSELSMSSYDTSYYVCKPTTREWREIPRPRMDVYVMRTEMAVVKGNDDLSLCYKIFRFGSDPDEGGDCRCEIFDSRTWAWRELADLFKWDDLSFHCPRKSGVFANGAFHWLMKDYRIFAFHAYKETWKPIDIPQIDMSRGMNRDDRIRRRLVGLEGKVAIVYSTTSWMELWVLDDYHTKQTWRKIYFVNLVCPHDDGLHFANLRDMYSTDIAFMTTRSSLIWYDCKADSCSKIPTPRRCLDISFFPFQSDLSPCNIRQVHIP